MLASRKFRHRFWLENNKIQKHEVLPPRWLPVDLYVGGNEHAVLHLMYTRFITMALHDLGLIDFDNPFQKFRTNGMVLKDGTKMSKSKGNVIDPLIHGEKFGFDALKTYLQFMAPLADSRDFSENGLQGCVRWLEKVVKLADKVKKQDDEPQVVQKLHQLIAGVTADLEELRYNTAIAKLMEFTNAATRANALSLDTWQKLLTLVAPFAPALAEEMWERAGHTQSIFAESTWPVSDPKLAQEQEIELVIQINGKVRGKLQVAPDIS